MTTTHRSDTDSPSSRELPGRVLSWGDLDALRYSRSGLRTSRSKRTAAQRRGSAARQRASRDRAARGRMLLTIEVDAVDLPEWLVRQELLRWDHNDDRKLIAAALARALVLLAAADR